MRILTCPARYSAVRRGTGNTPLIYNSGANLQLPCDVLQVDEISTDPVRQDNRLTRKDSVTKPLHSLPRRYTVITR